MTDNLRVILRDHLTLAQLTSALGAIEPVVTTDRPKGLIVDVLSMTGYDSAARTYFVEWHRKHRAAIRRTAIVTVNTMWHFVIQAMSLAAHKEMKAFGDLKQAERWLSIV